MSVWLDETSEAIAFQRPVVVLEYIGGGAVEREISKTTRMPWMVLDCLTDGEKALLKQLVIKGKVPAEGADENVGSLNQKLGSMLPALADRPIAYQNGYWCAVFHRPHGG